MERIAHSGVVSISKVLSVVVVLVSTLTGSSKAVERQVPGEYATIQAAIDDCNDGDEVVIAMGTYTGAGNRDIRIVNKQIMVRSIDPNDPVVVTATVIDCQASDVEPHRGFYAYNTDVGDAVLAGLTVVGGYRDKGGGLFCGRNARIVNCVITANQASRYGGGVYLCDGSPEIINCVIEDNQATDQGGGVYAYDCLTTLAGCNVKGNFAGLGGGVYADRGRLDMTECTVCSNQSQYNCAGIRFQYCAGRFEDCNICGNLSPDYAGGISGFHVNVEILRCRISENIGSGLVLGSSLATIADCELVANTATAYLSRGGGITAGDSLCTITNCLIACNSVGGFNGRGGGIYIGQDGVRDEQSLISGCRIIGNYANVSGGGCYIMGRGPGPDIHNCLFAENSCGFRGGAIHIANEASVRLSGCTITANESGYLGGGLYCTWSDSISIRNCIAWANTCPQGAEIAVEPRDCPHSVSIAYSNIAGGRPAVFVSDDCDTIDWSPTNIDADPCFVDPDAANYRLSMTSPCVDSADPAYMPYLGETDMEGQPRLMGLAMDMGADEFTDTPVPLLYVEPNSMHFAAVIGAPAPPEQSLSFRTVGTGLTQWRITVDAPWLHVNPTEAAMDADIHEVTVGIDISSLQRGLHFSDIVITAPGAVGSPHRIQVQLDLAGTLNVPEDLPTIQQAVDAALQGEIVLVADGTYTGPGNYDITFAGKAITLRSLGGPDNCIVDCRSDNGLGHRGFIFDNDETRTSVLDGFTVTGGFADSGGAVFCGSSSPTITNCRLTGNRACDGGGIYLAYGDAIVSNCVISGNRAYSGGGGAFVMAGSPQLNNCLIVGNDIYTLDEDMSARCLCTPGAGGGGSGGGIYVVQPTALMMTNCTIAGNRADAQGGGLFHGDYDFGWSDPGVEAARARTATADPYIAAIDNSIIWGNHPAEVVYSSDYLQIAFSCIEVGLEGPAVGNPLFVADGRWDPNGTPEDANDDVFIIGDYHLQWSSPCIDAGDPNYILDPNETGDIDGEPRIMGGGVDIGTDEVGPKQADFTRDGIVEFADFATILENWTLTETAGNWYVLADLSGDGYVDFLDLGVLIEDWLWEADWHK